MTTSPSSNFHTLSQMILWQYEHSPNIVRWIRELSATGYATCGMVFDDIIGGIMELLSNVNSIGMWIAQTLIASKGFDWKDGRIFQVVDREAEFLRAFYYSRFIGVGNLDEFYQTLRTFGRTDIVDRNNGKGPLDIIVADPDGALIRTAPELLGYSLGWEGEQTPIKYLSKKGMPIPLSVYSDWDQTSENDKHGMKCFQFGKPYKNPDGSSVYQHMRLCTDDEKSFYKINSRVSDTTTATRDIVANGTVFTRRDARNAE
ncbi:MAG: hypothetical protein MJZ81_07275 [Bacteroidales bacterium]|nr:hypothetical protein [Bacteroidales bacterium]